MLLLIKAFRLGGAKVEGHNLGDPCPREGAGANSLPGYDPIPQQDGARHRLLDGSLVYGRAIPYDAGDSGNSRLPCWVIIA